MASFFSKAWFQEELGALRERAATWPMPWQVKIINSQLYLREDKGTGCLGIYRRTDNQLILSMTPDDGDIRPHHLGLWEPEFAIAVGEALVLLARIHQERMRLNQLRKDGERPTSGLARYPELERSRELEAFFAIATVAPRVRRELGLDLLYLSRDLCADCTLWANEFVRIYAASTWDEEFDDAVYLLTIENFTRAKFTELVEDQRKG